MILNKFSFIIKSIKKSENLQHILWCHHDHNTPVERGEKVMMMIMTHKNEQHTFHTPHTSYWYWICFREHIKVKPDAMCWTFLRHFCDYCKCSKGHWDKSIWKLTKHKKFSQKWDQKLQTLLKICKIWKDILNLDLVMCFQNYEN